MTSKPLVYKKFTLFIGEGLRLESFTFFFCGMEYLNNHKVEFGRAKSTAFAVMLVGWGNRCVEGRFSQT